MTPPSTIAQGRDRYLGLLKAEHLSMFPGFKREDPRTETSGGLPALYIAFTSKNSAGQTTNAAQRFVAAKDRMLVVSFSAPGPFDRELKGIVDSSRETVRLAPQPRLPLSLCLRSPTGGHRYQSPVSSYILGTCENPLHGGLLPRREFGAGSRNRGRVSTC